MKSRHKIRSATQNYRIHNIYIVVLTETPGPLVAPDLLETLALPASLDLPGTPDPLVVLDLLALSGLPELVSKVLPPLV